MITSYLGGNIEKIEGHINIKHEVSLIDLKEDIKVNSFHSFALKKRKFTRIYKTFCITQNR